ncbi:MAG: glycoside hydrolase family 88 protein [Bacteroidales bacterium]|nr:glycoside hydrolase family 88 protein [Bacteroidales bacterium]
MKKLLTIFSAAVICLMSASCTPKQESMEDLTQRVFDLAKSQYTNMVAALPEGQLPRTTDSLGNLVTSNMGWWCSGFFGSSLWYVYEYTKDEAFRSYAEKYTLMLDPLKTNTAHHDIGFQINCSYGNALRITGDEKYREPIITAAHSLATRFSPVVGCTRSWTREDPEHHFLVIIDNMMNLELFLNAAKLEGNDSFIDMAVSHANTTIKNHFRPDYSCWHVVDYNTETGDVNKKHTNQGLNDDSAWSRGQSWGLYGYTMMYEFTGQEQYLEQAKNIAEYLIGRLPEDGIPYWDYDDPNIPDANRDASAGAIMASALVKLSELESDPQLSGLYLATAENQLRSLASPAYLAAPGTNGNFLLLHSVGSIPHNSEVNVALSYADYYFLEALLRYSNLPK